MIINYKDQFDNQKELNYNEITNQVDSIKYLPNNILWKKTDTDGYIIDDPMTIHQIMFPNIYLAEQTDSETIKWNNKYLNQPSIIFKMQDARFYKFNSTINTYSNLLSDPNIPSHPEIINSNWSLLSDVSIIDKYSINKGLGPLINPVSLHLYFAGSSWDTSFKNQIIQFYNDFWTCEAIMNILLQYGITSGAVTDVNIFGSGVLTDTDVTNLLKTYLSGVTYDPQGFHLVFMDSQSVFIPTEGVAYHFNTTVDGHTIYYGIISWQNNINKQTFPGSHELVEGITDPLGTTWISPSNLELSDVCETTKGNIYVNNRKWNINPIWDRTNQKCSIGSTSPIASGWKWNIPNLVDLDKTYKTVIYQKDSIYHITFEGEQLSSQDWYAIFIGQTKQFKTGLTSDQIKSLWITQQLLANPLTKFMTQDQLNIQKAQISQDYTVLSTNIIAKYSSNTINTPVGTTVNDDSDREPFFIDQSTRVGNELISSHVMPYWTNPNLSHDVTIYDTKLWTVIQILLPDKIINRALEFDGPLEFTSSKQVTNLQDVFQNPFSYTKSLDALNIYFLRGKFDIVQTSSSITELRWASYILPFMSLSNGLWRYADNLVKLQEAKFAVETNTDKEEWYNKYIVPLLNALPPEPIKPNLNSIQEILNIHPGSTIIMQNEGYVLNNLLELYSYFSPPSPSFGYKDQLAWYLIREFEITPTPRDINFCLRQRGFINIKGDANTVVINDGKTVNATNLNSILPYTVKVISHPFYADITFPNKYFIDQIRDDTIRYVPKDQPWNWEIWTTVNVGGGETSTGSNDLLDIIWVKYDMNFSGIQTQNRYPNSAELLDPSLYESAWHYIEGTTFKKWGFGFIDPFYQLIMYNDKPYSFICTDIDGEIKIIPIVGNEANKNQIKPFDTYNWDWYKNNFLKPDSAESTRTFELKGISKTNTKLAVQAIDYNSKTKEELLIKLPGHKVVSETSNLIVTSKSDSRFDDSFRFTTVFDWYLINELWQLQFIKLNPWTPNDF